MKNTTKQLDPAMAAELQRLLRQTANKAKASVSLSENLLDVADAVAGKSQRSALVERALRRYLKLLLRRARDARDLAAIAAAATATNRESDELLQLQSWPE